MGEVGCCLIFLERCQELKAAQAVRDAAEEADRSESKKGKAKAAKAARRRFGRISHLSEILPGQCRAASKSEWLGSDCGARRELPFLGAVLQHKLLLVKFR